MLGSKTLTFGPRTEADAPPGAASPATSASAASVRKRRIDIDPDGGYPRDPAAPRQRGPRVTIRTLPLLRKPRAGNLDGGGEQHRLARRLARLLVEVRRSAGDERAPVLAAQPAREDAEAVRHRDLVD